MDNAKVKMRAANLAIVLLDIIGSTQFVQRVGAVRAAKWLQYHDRLARSLVYKYGGREIDRSDGFMLSFETVNDAVAFGLAYQRELPGKTKLQARIGIHYGQIVEVQQAEAFVNANAKRIELEGIAKNIAARTMSVCGPGQVMLTKEAHRWLRQTRFMSKDTMVACVGLYRFKGVREPQELYAVGECVKALQPPPSSDKVKRLGGPKYIKKRARDRKFLEWVEWVFWRVGLVATLIWLYLLYPFIISGSGRYYLDPYIHYLYLIHDFIRGLIWP